MPWSERSKVFHITEIFHRSFPTLFVYNEMTYVLPKKKNISAFYRAFYQSEAKSKNLFIKTNRYLFKFKYWLLSCSHYKLHIMKRYDLNGL